MTIKPTAPDPAAIEAMSDREYARNLVLNLAEAIARRTHGDEVCDAALAWFSDARKRDQDLDKKFLGAIDPWESMVTWYTQRGRQ